MARLAILEFYRRALARLDVRMRSLLIQYSRAEAEILANILAAMAADRVKILRERRRQEAHARQILRVVDESTRIIVPEIVNQSFQTGVRIAELGTGERYPGLSRVNRDAMKLLTENLIEDLGAATQTVGRRVEDVFRREALRVAFNTTPGEQPKQLLSDELQRSLRREGLTAFVDRSGRQWTLKNYSEMATYTVSQEAINSSELNILLERGIDLVEINSVANPCKKVCAEYDGNTYSLTGRSKEYPRLEVKFPLHPRCRHVVFPSPLAMRERRESGWEPAPTPALELVER